MIWNGAWYKEIFKKALNASESVTNFNTTHFNVVIEWRREGGCWDTLPLRGPGTFYSIFLFLTFVSQFGCFSSDLAHFSKISCSFVLVIPTPWAECEQPLIWKCKRNRLVLIGSINYFVVLPHTLISLKVTVTIVCSLMIFTWNCEFLFSSDFSHKFCLGFFFELSLKSFWEKQGGGTSRAEAAGNANIQKQLL